MRYLKAAALTTLMFSFSAIAITTIKGTMNVYKPEFVIENKSGTLISNVRNFKLEARQTVIDDYCTVTTDNNLALQGGTLSAGYCLFEWNNTAGYSIDGFKVEGVASNSGPNSIGYSIYYYSGSAKAKKLVDTKNFIFNFEAPVKPTVQRYSVKLGNSWKSVGSHTNYNPANKFSAVRVNVDARNYSQKVSIPSLGSCTVVSGATSCDISFSEIKLGDAISNKVGSLSYQVSVDSSNSYWGVSNTKHALTVPWNYQPTKIDLFEANSMPASYATTKTINVNSKSIQVSNNTAKLVLNKPSSEIVGDWWAPSELNVKFTRNSQPTISSGIIYSGNVLYTKDGSLVAANKTITSTKRESVNGAYVYTFDMTQIEDGYYGASVAFTNSSGIPSNQNFNGLRINKTAPKIDIFKSGVKQNNSSNFAYNQELVISTFNSFTDDVDLVSIQVNSSNVAFNKPKIGVATIPDTVIFKNGLNTIKVTVKDTLGHLYSRTITLNKVQDEIEFKINNLGGRLVSHVKESSFEAVQTKFSGFCDIVTNEAVAIGTNNNVSGKCYFEWVGMDELDRDNFSLKGRLRMSGVVPVGYKVFAYFGAEKEKTLIKSGTTSFNVEAPIAPELTKYSIYVGNKWIDNNSDVNHDPNAQVKAISITTKPVNYSQQVIVDNLGNCLINAGSTSCTINITPYFLGNKNYIGYEDGIVSHQFKVNSINKYFTDKEINSQAVVSWEYAYSRVEQVKVNARASGLPLSFGLLGASIDVENETARVVFDKPSPAISGTWWLPKSIELEFKVSGSHEVLKELEFDGTTLFKNDNITEGETVIVKNLTGPELINNKFIYTADVQSVPDGHYDITVTSKYLYSKSDKKEFKNAAFLSRKQPSISIFRNSQSMEEDDEFYFDSELLVAGFNGYVNGVTIESVQSNGVPLSLNSVGDGIVTINGLTQQLSPKDNAEISVVVKNSSGDKFNYDLNVVFAPMSFDIKHRENDYLPFRLIELVYLDSKQVSGEECRFYSERDLAVKYARKGVKSCIFNWVNLPEGFEISLRGRTPSAVGYLDKALVEIESDIEIINEFGETLIIPNEKTLISSQEPTGISVEASSRRELINGFYPVEYSGGEIVRMGTVSSPGSLDMTFDTKGVSQTFPKNPSTRTGEIFRTSGRFDMPFEVERNLWEVFPIDYNVKYHRMPEINASQSIKALVVPDSTLGVNLDFQDDQILSTDEVTAKINLGNYNRIDGWVYDKSSMGEWEVYIGKYDRRNIPEPLTETVTIDAKGEAFIKMPMEVIGEESGIYVAVAKAKTPIPDYEYYIQSARAYFIVYKGTEIEGELRDGLIKGRIPLRASAIYSPEDRADVGSLGRVVWEVSSNGSDWRESTEHKDTLRWRKRYENEEIEYLRVKVENKFTGEWSTSGTLKVVAYEKPELLIQQTNEVLFNEAAKFVLYDGDNLVQNGDSVIEWSTDNRKSWFSGPAKISFYKDDFTGRDINARMKYNGIASDSSLGDEAFVEARARYYFLRAPRFYFDLDIPDLVEVGSTHHIKGSSFTRTESINGRTQNQWVLPDGKVINDSEFDLTFSENLLEGRNFILTYQAWVEGSKQETINETRVRVKSWTYEFPEIELNMPATVNYMPSKHIAWVGLERHFAPGVEYAYELLKTPGVKVLNQDDGKFTLQFSQEGMKNLMFRVTNSRGQSKEVSQIVEVLPPTPLEIEIVRTFSNEYLRYPLDVSLRSRVWLSHPDDRVAVYKWYLDGELVMESKRYRESIGDLSVGNHSIRVDVETEFGQTGSQSFEVNVIPNQKPTGSINMHETDQVFELHLNCNDSDGRIAATTWQLNGELLTHSHNIIQLSKDKLKGTNYVVGRCYDDSFEFIDITQTIH